MRLRANDLGLGSTWGVAWALLATRGLPLNPVGIGIGIVVAYAMLYTAAAVAIAWGVRIGAGRALHGHPRAASLAAPGALAVLVVIGARATLTEPLDVALVLVATLGGPLPYVRALLPIVGLGALLARADHATPLDLAPAPLPPAPAGPKVVVFGMDGLDLELLDRWTKKGKLPHFARLLEEGTAAPMETVSHRSPVVWTSIATGRAPADHRVGAYTTAWLGGSGALLPQDPADRLGAGLDALLSLRRIGAVSAAERRVPAVWEVAAAAGVRPLVINWWASFPAEPVDGVIVTNHAIPWTRLDAEARAEVADTPGAVWPASLGGKVAGIVAAEVVDRGAAALQRDSRTAEGSAFFTTRDDVVLSLFFALDGLTFPLAMFYTQDTDTASHAYSEQVFGGNYDQKRKRKVSKNEANTLFASLVYAAYERQDARLGAVMDALPDGAGLLVVSDHGWEYNGRSHWGKPDGTFLAWGGPFAAAGRLERVHVYDVLPTLAAVMGLPLSDELPGKIVRAALVAVTEPAHVPTYGGRVTVERAPAAPDADHVERLRQLGYVE